MDLSEVSKLEAGVRITRLSEAIRIGAKLRPQCSQYAFIHGASCAIGAAAEALGMPYQNGTLGGEAWDFIRSQLTRPLYLSLYKRIWSMNDGRDGCGWPTFPSIGMSREAIADVLEAEGY